jgi:hypothetical protein
MIADVFARRGESGEGTRITDADTEIVTRASPE